MKRQRIEIWKLKVPRGSKGSSREVAKILNRRLRPSQSVLYIKHNTLVNNTAFWTVFVENLDVLGEQRLATFARSSKGAK